MPNQVPSPQSPAQRAGLGSLDSFDAWLTSVFDPDKFARVSAEQRLWETQRAGGAMPSGPTLSAAAGRFSPDLMARSQRGLAINPYSAPMADQARAAQLALMQQMEAQRMGPSLAAMQGRQAMGQSTQQALMQGALGGGRGAMLGAGQAGQGLASDVARARMIEDLKARAGIGGVATGLRGQDIRSAEQQMRAGQQAQGLSDEMARFYASQGSALSEAARGDLLERYKLSRRLQQSATKEGMQNQQQLAEAGATALDIAL